MKTRDNPVAIRNRVTSHRFRSPSAIGAHHGFRHSASSTSVCCLPSAEPLRHPCPPLHIIDPVSPRTTSSRPPSTVHRPPSTVHRPPSTLRVITVASVFLVFYWRVRSIAMSFDSLSLSRVRILRLLLLCTLSPQCYVTDNPQ